MLTLKKINFKPNNFNYYFKIILRYRNDNDYCSINNVEKVIPKESYEWLKKNHKNRIFLIIKYKAKNVGMINFNKLDKTFSIVIDRNYRNIGLGGLGFRAWKLLLRYLKSQKYKHLITYALKSNISAYKLNLYFSYKKKILRNGFTKFYIDVEKY